MVRIMLAAVDVLVGPWSRRFIAIVVIGALTAGTASIALFASPGNVCERERHHSGATLRPDCCPSASPATPANTVLARSIATVIKIEQGTVAWLSVVAGGRAVVDSVGHYVVALPFSSPPPSPHSDSLVALLI